MDVPGEKLTAGDVGIVVHIYGEGRAYEVRFVSLHGETVAIVSLKPPRGRPVERREITHAPSVDKDPYFLRPLNGQFARGGGQWNQCSQQRKMNSI